MARRAAERVAFILHDVFRYSFAEGDRIKHIWAVRNPHKLRPWTTR
jgi:hypothetical protein